MQETDAKRNRADKKAVDERRLRILKEGDIVSLKALLDELKAEKESTSTVVEKNMRYVPNLLTHTHTPSVSSSFAK